ncbi:hypothetical protein B0H13DRAFT_1878809 [Mycena leptocephala]|nr:hypothetical protein B0H13DRAFT_1878809 [Mycena leptocephala]
MATTAMERKHQLNPVGESNKRKRSRSRPFSWKLIFTESSPRNRACAISPDLFLTPGKHPQIHPTSQDEQAAATDAQRLGPRLLKVLNDHIQAGKISPSGAPRWWIWKVLEEISRFAEKGRKEGFLKGLLTNQEVNRVRRSASFSEYYNGYENRYENEGEDEDEDEDEDEEEEEVDVSPWRPRNQIFRATSSPNISITMNNNFSGTVDVTSIPRDGDEFGDKLRGLLWGAILHGVYGGDGDESGTELRGLLWGAILHGFQRNRREEGYRPPLQIVARTLNNVEPPRKHHR